MSRLPIIMCFCFAFFTCAICTFGQLEKVFVETYYVSDANDATDAYGGGIAEGSTTYRIYVDLVPGTILKGMFGDVDHPFSIMSTQPFFNHATDGQTFAKEFIKNRYTENTVALDTWLTLGQTTRKQGNITYFGIPKSQDTDGSFIGGDNNDGGSAEIAGGLLVNDAPLMGVPLTLSDGMDTLEATPNDWTSNGVIDFFSGIDSTIFGSVITGSVFESQNFSLSCSGVEGVVRDSNQVLVAQLTTQGELSFQLNLELQFLVDGVWQTMRYVSSNDVVSENEVYSPYLSYPYSCGCKNPSFLEYSATYVCNDESACITPIVLGCMDTLACNFDVHANLNVADLCCYPGWCNNRNLEEVCPQLKGNSFDFTIFPNPTTSDLTLQVVNGVQTELRYSVFDSYGVLILNQVVASAPLNFSTVLQMAQLDPGIYSIQVNTTQDTQQKLFVKL